MITMTWLLFLFYFSKTFFRIFMKCNWFMTVSTTSVNNGANIDNIKLKYGANIDNIKLKQNYYLEIAMHKYMAKHVFNITVIFNEFLNFFTCLYFTISYYVGRFID